MGTKKNWLIGFWTEAVATKEYFKKTYPKTYKHTLSVVITAVTLGMFDTIAYFQSPEAFSMLRWYVILLNVVLIFGRSLVKAFVQDYLGSKVNQPKV